MTSKAICLASDVGDRFSPTNEEIINHFLRHKLLGNDHLVSKIPQLDIYQFDPWDLPWINSKDREGYFFSPLHAKNSYTNNGRINRSTNTGSWQAKGRDCKVTSELNGEVIGIKKIFVHSCIKDGIKYVMHEFSASFNLPNCRDLRALVLCKVMMKTLDKKTEGSYKKVKETEEEARSPPASDEDQQTDNLICDDGGTNCLAASASANHAVELTIPEEVDVEISPHLQLFPGYDQQDYNHGFIFYDQPLILTGQLHADNGPGTSSTEEDMFNGLGLLWD